MNTNWKSLSLSLKIVSVLFALWALGSLFAVSARYDLGLPFFGLWVSGVVAALIVLLLDVIGPLAVLVGIFMKKSWTLAVAFVYIGIFVLNSVVALFTFQAQLGLLPILIPSAVNLVLLGILYSNRNYFV